MQLVIRDGDSTESSEGLRKNVRYTHDDSWMGYATPAQANILIDLECLDYWSARLPRLMAVRTLSDCQAKSLAVR